MHKFVWTICLGMKLLGHHDKECACNAGDPGLIPGLERSVGEGIGYLIQYCLATLVAQLVKNLPATQEIWVRYLGWEDPLEKGKATHSSILAWRISWTVHGVAKSRTGLSNFHFHGSQAILSCIDPKSFLLPVKPNRKGQLE